MNEEHVFPVGDAAYDAIYAQEAAMIDASELIARELEASGISRAELARRLGVSRGEITARLKGERNLTVRTLAETLHVLGGRLELDAARPPATRRMPNPMWTFRDRPAAPSRLGWVREVAHNER